MKQSKINLNPERDIITNLIGSTEFCKKLLPILQNKYFKSPYARTLLGWIRDYFDHYQEAPQKLIQTLFVSHKIELDEEEIVSIQEFIVSLFPDDAATNLEITNIDYQINNALQYIRLRALELLKNELEECVITGNILKGEAEIANFSQIGLPQTNAINIFDAQSDIINAFTEENESLFNFPGALQKVISPVMRGDLYAFIGKPKGQKTTALLYTAERAALCGCRVIFFSLEMRKNQILRRCWQSLNGCPYMPGDYELPYFDTLLVDADKYTVATKIIHKDGIDFDNIQQAQQSLKLFFRGGEIRFITMPRFSASVDDIIYYLDNLMYYDKFIPDVVIIDYADILKPSTYAMKDEYRHRLNDIWMKLAALAQERNICIWTATQTNRQGLHGDIELDAIAEEFRKIAHVSMLIAINQNKAEKQKHVIRLKALIKRDDFVSDDDEAMVLQQLSWGKFYIDSKPIANVVKIDET